MRTLSGLQERVLHDPLVMERLLRDLSINVTSMFRDPAFFRALREQVVPLLRTYPFVRIWNAGARPARRRSRWRSCCAEEGLLERTRIYATDINDDVLAAGARRASSRSTRCGTTPRTTCAPAGTATFSRYYTVDGDRARVRPGAHATDVVFAQHNLATDGVVQRVPRSIVCRNVLIYFGRPLQERVHDLFYESLGAFGVLALGHKESIRVAESRGALRACSTPAEKLYRQDGDERRTRRWS